MSAEFEEFKLPLAGREYTFRFGLREVIELQERLITDGVVPTIPEIDAGVRAGRLRYQVALVWAGLQKHHPQSDDAVLSLWHQASRRELDAILIGFGYSVTPDPKDVAALGVTPDPPQAQSETTGESCTSEPAVPV